MSAFLLATVMAVAPPAAGPTHTVAAGEFLTWIAECRLGDADRMPELIELNPELAADPDLIQPGWELVLPEDASGECGEPPRLVASTNQPQDASRAQSRGQGGARTQSASPSPSRGNGLDRIRQCESGGNYGAVSSSGKYRGAYQFDQQTWESVGGSGDPAAASPAEQDQRAQALKQQRGSSPWPTCG